MKLITKQLTTLIALAALTLYSQIGATQDRPIKEFTEPVGTTCIIEGIEHKAFNLEEWKIAAKIITDYHTLWKYSNGLELKIDSLGRDLKTWEMRSDNWKSLSDQHKQSLGTMTKMFESQYDQFQKTLKLQSRTGWMPWALVCIISIGFGFVGVYSAVR